MSPTHSNRSPLDSARVKAFLRLLPILFVCYIIAYIDRNNVAIAKLTMGEDLPLFDSAVFGFGGGFRTVTEVGSVPICVIIKSLLSTKKM